VGFPGKRVRDPDGRSVEQRYQFHGGLVLTVPQFRVLRVGPAGRERAVYRDGPAPVQQELPERIEDPAAIAVLAAILHGTPAPPSPGESTTHERNQPRKVKAADLRQGRDFWRSVPVASLTYAH
jgi:hypothetical protein